MALSAQPLLGRRYLNPRRATEVRARERPPMQGWPAIRRGASVPLEDPTTADLVVGFFLSMRLPVDFLLCSDKVSGVMLKIRMQRTGRKNEPQFRIVVGEHTMGPKSGRFLEKLGSYDPKNKQKTLDVERVKYWMGKGAGLSDTVHNLFITMGVVKGDKINVLPKKTVPKKEETAAPASASPEVTA